MSKYLTYFNAALVAFALTLTTGSSANTTASPDGKHAYTITKDETLGPIKRTVEATLPARVDENTLAAIATEIKESNKKKFKLTLIGWRIQGEKADAYWANARFDPELKIDIIGTPAGK